MRTRFARPLAAGALVAVTVAAVAMAPGATAASGAGDASSSATVLSLQVGSDELDAVTVALEASNISSPSALIRVVPVTLNGTKYGEQKVTDGSKSVGAVSQSVAGIAAVTSPGVSLQAGTTNGPVAKLSSTALGSVSLLGVDLPGLNGTLGFGSSVVNGTANAAKSVEVHDLALPSLTDLLGKLGLDITKVPTDVLGQLVDQLDLVTPAITNATNAVTAATADVAQQAADVADAQTALTGALTAAPFSNAAVQAVLSALGITGTPTIAEWQSLNNATQNSIVALLDAATSGTGTAIDAADAALATAQAALAAAQALLDPLLTTLTGLLTGALDTPLVSLGSLEIGTIANAGGKHVAKVIGTVSGLEVLGTDILETVTGSSSIDLPELVGGTLTQVQDQIDALTGAVSSVLSSVAGLDVSLPKVTVLQRATSTKPKGNYQAASAAVTGLALSWDGITTLPAVLGVANIASLPAVTQLSSTVFASRSLRVQVATLNDAARFSTASSGTPSGVTPNGPNSPNASDSPDLATTGLPTSLAVIAVTLMCAAYGVRRLRPHGD